MSEIDFEMAIADFLAMGRKIQAMQPLTARLVLDEVVRWYRESRIEGAALEEDADMLLLQGGASFPLLLSEPADLRQAEDDDLIYADEEQKYLNITRQVMISGGGDPESDDFEDFDDVAVQMSITLSYGLADGNEPSFNEWISTPDDLDKGVNESLGLPFVQERIDMSATGISISVGKCG